MEDVGRETSRSQGYFHLGYLPALDGLRGIFILLVIAYHVVIVDSSGSSGFMQGGFLGVDGFFVLSGFLITVLLLQEWNRSSIIHLREFYARRALRLLPALVVFLLIASIYVLIAPIGAEAENIRRDILPILFYHLNWIYALNNLQGSIINHTWSLSVEEQFYFAWPLVLIGILRLMNRRRQVIVLVLTGIIASALLRVVLWSRGATVLRLYLGLDTRADALLVGCLIALLASWGMLARSPRVLTLIRILAVLSTLVYGCLVVMASFGSEFLALGGLTLTAVAVGFIIIMLISAPIQLFTRSLGIAPLVWIGKISYGLYLWHYPIFIILSPLRLGLPLIVGLGLQFGVTLAIATFSFYFIERPFLALKSGFRTA